MSRTVFCQKLQKDGVGLEFQVYPGDLGQKIYDNISQEAWQLWLNQQTILINEYRLNPLEPESRQYLEQQMQKFLFESL